MKAPPRDSRPLRPLEARHSPAGLFSYVRAPRRGRSCPARHPHLTIGASSAIGCSYSGTYTTTYATWRRERTAHSPILPSRDHILDLDALLASVVWLQTNSPDVDGGSLTLPSLDVCLQTSMSGSDSPGLPRLCLALGTSPRPTARRHRAAIAPAADRSKPAAMSLTREVAIAYDLPRYMIERVRR